MTTAHMAIYGVPGDVPVVEARPHSATDVQVTIGVGGTAFTLTLSDEAMAGVGVALLTAVEDAVRRRCPVCKGGGYLSDVRAFAARRCETCDGDGMVRLVDDEPSVAEVLSRLEASRGDAAVWAPVDLTAAKQQRETEAPSEPFDWMNRERA